MIGVVKMLKVLFLWVFAIVIFFVGFWLGKRITELTLETKDDKKGGGNNDTE